MRQVGLPLWLLLVTILHHASSAPVQEKAAVDKRRESTKETIELEETLKQLAGEDKKYFSNSMAMPMPQVDGLQTEVEGSGDEPADEPPKQAPQVHPLEEQLQEERQDQLEDEEKELLELPELQQSRPADRFNVPGPYGHSPDFSNGGVELEYEPSDMRGLDEGEEEEEEDEDYYLERVMETLRRHPELLNEIMQEDEIDEGDENEVANSDGLQQIDGLDTPGDIDDYDDRMEQIQAELDNIRAQEQSLSNTENRQEYIGDRESHVVSKKHYIPKEYMKDDIQSLNRYFDKYSGEGSHEDVPIM